ncbi:ABC transporter ATP-binding protein [Phytoactinopolyspora halotolerans]|uniref:ATP-binding cassette domain-containing protein n=1 Tax=Phytoactinopolyspora halotolerans TaxID=1981512 RepID=A0A6L9S3Z7_9ACTN|nr:ATP-binding cassette domain-containing protein [Phytoactinopolyspora halotolerans]
MSPEGLEMDVVVDRGPFVLDVSVRIDAGEVVALLGPNGAGKSTLLGVLAGLIRPTAGRVALAGVTLDDVATGQHVPARGRRVGLVVQDYLLFGHMTVVENVAFGLRARGIPRRRARESAARTLERVGLGGLDGRKPRELSGGQAQRVALARALVVEPRLLLLDEPLAALDAGTRPAVRAELRRHLAGYSGCAIVVTHDPLEAMVLGDRLVVVEDGRVVQAGPPAEVARHPGTDYVARLVGLNLLQGTARGRTADVGAGTVIALAHEEHGPVHIAFSPSAVVLSPHRPDGSARNVWPGTVQDLETHGDLVRVTVSGALPVLADVTPLAIADLQLAPGMPVWASVKASEITAYPA